MGRSVEFSTTDSGMPSRAFLLVRPPRIEQLNWEEQNCVCALAGEGDIGNNAVMVFTWKCKS
jgi:hypothetical protein